VARCVHRHHLKWQKFLGGLSIFGGRSAHFRAAAEQSIAAAIIASSLVQTQRPKMKNEVKVAI